MILKPKLPKKPKIAKLYVPKPKLRVPKRLRRPGKEERSQEAFQSLPRITNETVAEHREEVLSSARKYIYPLEHSKHRIVVVSTVLLVAAIIGFFAYCGLALYRFQSSSAFVYRVTQVLPFPVAKAGSRYVAYENYLFELRRYVHYYQTQQRVDFGSKDGQKQLLQYKPQAMQEVIQAAYVKQLADIHSITVSDSEVAAQLDALRAQNQLGPNNRELSDVASEFFGWSLDDLKRELKQELLAQKVSTALDTAAQTRAQVVLSQVQTGADFAMLASKFSEDTASKANGGQYADTAITSASTDVPPAVVRELLKLQPGQASPVISAGTTLEIVKLIANKNGSMQAAHISIKLQDISTYITPLQKAHPTHYYITVK